MSTPSVVVTRLPPGHALDRLAGVAELSIWEENAPMPDAELRRRIVDADGLYCMATDAIDAGLLVVASRLRAISTMAVGVDNIDLEACTARGIPVGHTPDVLTETTADTAFMLLMAAARRLVEGVDYVRAGRWTSWDPELLLGADVHGTTLGVVGLGRIGKAVARRAAGFGMRVIYHNRRRDGEAEAELGVAYRDLDALLAEADHVVLLTPLTDDTYHLIDGRRLGAMKPTATLVNAGRGGLVDPAALAEALREGAIGAAALDVTEPEPIPVDDPLLDLDNCIVIPHLGSSSLGTRIAMADLAVDNLIAGLAGEPMAAVANPAVYCRGTRRPPG